MEGKGVGDAVRRRSGRDSCSVGRATPVCIPGSKNAVPLAPSGGRWGVVWASMPRYRPLLLPGRLYEASTSPVGPLGGDNTRFVAP
ncbi:hypothetical protein THAOC_02183 [Thalassiosira oceanica]|uniref:Uncharacterized protein n=1 Tax=Thalassiosira oceanica TaxID=159749 RepID=K0TMC3_THAOC|nr:hypothetical protein THAOC_02183 [Thalassiosira oceanica]|eukprot:EJK76076.1 hypothetical protein THAOC_02183 [Thalassiosira oceanica]